MTPFEECQAAARKLLTMENMTKKKLEEIQKAKMDIILLMCGKDELVSNKCKEILKEIEDNK